MNRDISIPGAVALAITTPFGVLLHTGDFKIDLTPLDGQPIDINRLAYYGSKGVLALMSDSTNVEKPGYTQSEREIGKTFEHYFDIAHGRMIVASFASNVWRLQQVADVAIRHGRVICFAGRSMEQIVAASQKLGYLNIPEDKIVKVDQLKKFNDDKVCIITTGSQGEPMSGLYRMANASHKVNVGKGDTVIISASAIPGNEKGVARVINNLFEKGAYVVYDRMADVHVSGHACREELKLMLHIIKPRYFIPAHGEQRHLMMHAQLAEDMGVPPENVFVVNIGETVSFSKNGAQRGGSVASGSVMVDGSDSIGNVVLNDRKQLADDGLLVAVMTIHKETGRQMAPTEIISRGFVYMKDSEELIHQAVESIQSEVERFEKDRGITGCGSVTARGSVQLARALVDTGLAGRIPAIGSDVFGENIENLKRGVFQNLMFKNPYQQGWLAAEYLFKHIFRNQPTGDTTIFVKSEVVFQSSISMYKE